MGSRPSGPSLRLGALTYRHIAIAGAEEWAEEAPSASVGEIMEAPWRGLDRSRQEGMSDELLNYYRKRDFTVVVDGQRRVVGIVQLWDIARELWNAAQS